MNSTKKHLLLLPTITIICMTIILLTSCSISGDEQNSLADDKRRGSEEYTIVQESATEEDYASVYPFYGMREDALKRCALGDPAAIELCRDFSKLLPRARYKTYVFGDYGKPLSGNFTVKYRWHYSNRFDDYIDLPETNGYVAWGWFVDGGGLRYNLSRDGVEVQEYPSEQNNAKKPEEVQNRESDNTEVEPDDHDIEAYYEDNKDIYDSYDDAWEGFEDDEEAWDDY